MAYNLPGVDKLNLTAENVADIFSGKIKKWDDASIAKNNDGVELPSLDIIPVNRADKSGTTENSRLLGCCGTERLGSRGCRDLADRETVR